MTHAAPAFLELDPTHQHAPEIAITRGRHAAAPQNHSFNTAGSLSEARGAATTALPTEILKTIELALANGSSAAEILDQRSPIRDAIRAALSAAAPQAQPSTTPFCRHCGYDHSVGPLCEKAANDRAAQLSTIPPASEGGLRAVTDKIYRKVLHTGEFLSNDDLFSELAAELDRLDMTAAGQAAQPSTPKLTLNGYQLKEALEFIAPDGEPDQMESEITIAVLPADKSPLDDDNTPMPAGVYAWLADYPDEGAIPLLEEPKPVEAAQPSTIPPDERAEFETLARPRWTHPEDFDKRISNPNLYNNYEVQAAWWAWQARAALASQAAQPVSADTAATCEWSEDRSDYAWRSHCGKIWSFIDGGPAENGMCFCVGCGKPLSIAPDASDDDEDGIAAIAATQGKKGGAV